MNKLEQAKSAIEEVTNQCLEVLFLVLLTFLEL